MQSNFLTLGRPKTEQTYDHLGFYLFHPKNHILPSYVAWIAVSDVPHNALAMEFDESETTSISDELRVKSEEFASATEYYTLDGRKFEGKPTAKGLYIVNGRKVVIR
jgi:hypothetical protein